MDNQKEIKDLYDLINNKLSPLIEQISDEMYLILQKYPESEFYYKNTKLKSKTQLANLIDKLYNELIDSTILCGFILPRCKKRLKNGKNKII